MIHMRGGRLALGQKERDQRAEEVQHREADRRKRWVAGEAAWDAEIAAAHHADRVPYPTATAAALRAWDAAMDRAHGGAR